MRHSSNFRLLPVFLFLFFFGCKKSELFQKGLNAPVAFTYTRPDAPDIRIPIRSVSVNGFTSQQLTDLKDILNKLPAEHLRAVTQIAGVAGDFPQLANGNEAVGYAYYAEGLIVLKTGRVISRNRQRRLIFSTGESAYARLGSILIHEIGHMVKNRLLTRPEQQAWDELHSQSSKTIDTVSEYAETNNQEDFAETYENWTYDTGTFARDAVFAAISGHTLLLQKFLTMAATFANANGTLNFYSMGEDPHAENVKGDPTFVSSGNFRSGRLALDGPLSVTQVAYRFTDRLLGIGQYVFGLENGRITSIQDESGALIGNVSIALPEIVSNRLRKTAVDPFPLPGLHRSPEEAPSTLWSKPIQMVSPEVPAHYVPLNSPAGYSSFAAEQAFIHNPEQLPDLADIARPHGTFQVVPAK